MRSSHVTFVAVAMLCSLAFAPTAGANFGLGIIGGEPTGLSAKSWLGARTAVDAAAAWSFTDEEAVHLHADYLVHFFDLIDLDRGALPLYAGIGGRVKLGDEEDRVGVRVPVGLAYLFPRLPLDAFLEVVPLLDLNPETELNLNAAVGVRYFFGSSYAP